MLGPSDRPDPLRTGTPARRHVFPERTSSIICQDKRNRNDKPYGHARNDGFSHGTRNGGFLWLLLIGLLAWGIYRLVSASGATRLTGESPFDTVRCRYAEGRISTEEYEERKEILSS